MSTKKRILVDDTFLPIADTTWDAIGARTLHRARKSLARSLWADTQTEDFPTVSKAFNALKQESEAAVNVAAWQYLSSSQTLDSYACKLIRESAWSWARKTQRDRSGDTRPYLDGLQALLEPRKPSAEELILSDRYLGRTMRIRAIANACGWYDALRFAIQCKSSINGNLGWDVNYALEQMYRFLGQADAYEIVLVERAHTGLLGRERVLEERRKVALDAIQRVLSDYAHLSAPQIADEIISPNIKVSHRELVKLINEERRTRGTVLGNARG